MNKNGETRTGVLTYISNFIKHIFLSGFFTILPIGFTLFFVKWSYSLVYSSLEPLRHLVPPMLRNIPGSEFLFATLIIIGVGVILRIFIIKSIVHYFEHIIDRIPFVRVVYSSAKMLVDFFKINEKAKGAERKVVMIQYPRPGNYHLAFLLDPAQDNYQKLIPGAGGETGKHYYKVFMPNSPNPTTGYFFILPEDEIIHTDITFEEAVKVLVSCGILTPESLSKK